MQATFVPHPYVPGEGNIAFWGTQEPAAGAKDLGSGDWDTTAGSGRLPTLLPSEGSLVGVDVPAVLVPVGEAVRVLAALPLDDRPDRDLSDRDLPDGGPADGGSSDPGRPGPSVRAWAVAARLALEHVTAGHVSPVLRRSGTGRAFAHWRTDLGGDPRLVALAEALPGAAHALRLPDPQGGDPGTADESGEQRVWAPYPLLTVFCDAVADACVRATATDTATDTATSTSTDTDGDDWPRLWLRALTGPGTAAGTDVPDEALERQLAEWADAVGGERAAARIALRLALPAGPDEPWPLTFHLQTVDEPDVLVSAERVWATAASALTVGNRVLDRPQETLTEGLALAARTFPPVAACLTQDRPTRIGLTARQAAALLGDGGRALRTAGCGVLVPDELGENGGVLTPRLRVGSRRSSATGGHGGKAGSPAAARRSRTVAYRWEAVVGDEVLTVEETAALAARGEPLARWRDRWVRVDCERVDALAALVGSTGRLAMAEALSVVLCGRHRTEEFGDVPALAVGSVADLVGDLRQAGARKEPELAGVQAELREYQRTGVAWLQSLTGLGFGALLADDMGLGKTLQTIALLAGRSGERPQLVVCPTSVMSNWERELARFAPGLTVRRHHGSRRATDAAEFAPGDVVVTSYALLRLDAELLTSVDWDLAVLDEAQQIKNHTAQAARAASQLTAQARVALTGTPVENRLSELWSIMNFANPGLLGTHRRFKERFADPIEREKDPEAAERLRTISAPFVLRRLKKTVVEELPAKLQSTVPCNLTAEQVSLYRAAVASAFDTDGSLGTGIARQGNVLRLLTELKQICNHPAQYLGRGDRLAADEKLTGRSGKLERATEMLSEAVAAGHRALVFTQYRVMGDLLARHFQDQLGLDRVPFLNGSTPPEQRDRMVDEFQHSDTASPLLLVSLKAGGFGLNLTRASHVLHYDRWWNPAVEDQATDRAHRIGQTQTVHVHKLVTADTFEERIDALLESKRSLADSVVGTSETWLGALDDAALFDLVQLADSGDDK
ncbi:DEAD/DEAH box helicase [Streptomyces sp. NPDC021093]|uniref:DEAD/DEAH box helicase n=1 Tax=Streptomyces sp. NPDC021093 TaxID=3365112 RepID=UPI00378AB79F